MNIKRLMDLGCYRGLRHRRGLPVRGQRTHTNARTARVPKRGSARRGRRGRPRKESNMATSKPAAQGDKGKQKRRREEERLPTGIAHISSTFNNTLITITDVNGNTVAWASSGVRGFKGSRKSTPVRRLSWRRTMRPARRRTTACSRCPCACRVLARAASRHCAVCRARGCGSRSSRTSPHPPQRLPPAQAEEGLNHGTLHWSRVPALPA